MNSHVSTCFPVLNARIIAASRTRPSSRIGTTGSVGTTTADRSRRGSPGGFFSGLSGDAEDGAMRTGFVEAETGFAGIVFAEAIIEDQIALCVDASEHDAIREASVAC